MFTFTQFIQHPASSSPHFLVIGDPISHSLSPRMHTVALKHHSRHESYYALLVQSAELAEFVDWLRNSQTIGVNVTLPHKETILFLVDTLSEEAESSGAINTVVRRSGKLHGELTDLHGIRKVIEPHKDRIEGGKVLILGSGGASKAALRIAIDYLADSITIVSRGGREREPRVREARASDAPLTFIDYERLEHHLSEADLVIQATPIGMKGTSLEASSPISDKMAPLLAGKLCFDMVYTPLKTPFLAQCEQYGGIPLSGLEMLIHQGNAAFELWTGLQFPIDDVRQTLIEILTK